MFVESRIWQGYKPEDPEAYERLMKLIEPTGYRSPRKTEKEIRYLPLDPAKQIGKVTYFNKERGFGRIDDALFFHVSEMIDGNKQHIRPGVTVAYEEVIRRKGPEAVDIQLVRGETE